MERRTLIGVGKIYVGPYDGTDALYWIANASEINLEVETDEVSQRQYFKPGGGTYNKHARPSSGSISITGLEITDKMQEIAFLAAVGAQASASVSNELQPAAPGALSPLDKMLDTGQAVTIAAGVDPWANATVYPANSWVSDAGKYWFTELGGTSSGTSTADDTGVTWIDKGTSPTVPAEGDFTKSAGGMELDEAYVWPAGAPLKFSYTSKAETVTEALVNSGKEWRCMFDGFNEAESDTPLVCDVWKVKFSPAGLSLISEDFAEIPVEGEMLADDTKGVGKSQFYRLRYGSTG